MAHKPKSPAHQDPLTLEDVALLADEGEPTRETIRHLGEFIRSHHLFADRIRHLRALARDAAVKKLADGLSLHKELDQLVHARNWSHPAQVLDPDGFIGISYPELIRIAKVRVRRAEDSRPLKVIQRRLEEAQAAEPAEAEAPIHKIVERLQKEQPGTAERQLHQAILEFRETCRKREE